LQTQTVGRIGPQTDNKKERVLHIAKITRQVREGSYYASGLEIATKLIMREQQLFPVREKACIPPISVNGDSNMKIANAKTAR